MAYLFSSASSQCFIGASAPVATYPFTMACWFKTASSSSQLLMSIGVSGQSRFHRLLVFTSGSLQIFGDSFNTAYGASNSGTGSPVALNTWTHAAVVHTSATSRLVYKDGVAGTLNTTSVSFPAVNSLVIGANYDPSLTGYFNGDIAEAGVWNAGLSADEIASLAKGFPCRFSRPSGLVFYAPLIRNAMDIRGGVALTNNNGATVSNHPRIIYPC